MLHPQPPPSPPIDNASQPLLTDCDLDIVVPAAFGTNVLLGVAMLSAGLASVYSAGRICRATVVGGDVAGEIYVCRRVNGPRLSSRSSFIWSSVVRLHEHQ